MTTVRRSSVAGIVLAAGMSKRFGRNKLLIPLHGKPLLRWPVEAAVASRLERIVVVLGCERESVRTVLADLLDDDRLVAVVNDAYRQGQSRSVIAGLNAVRADFPAVMFLMGDQPLLGAGVIDDLIAAYEDAGGDICYPSCNGVRRNPVIFAERFYPDILALTGDTGARALIDAHPEVARAVEFTDEAAFRDVDHDRDLEALRRNGG